MKNHRTILASTLLLAGCLGRQPMPEQGFWTGSVELPDGIAVPLRMNLDLTAATPNGYFIVGEEKTPIPEISRSGDSLHLRFSEYGAEIQAHWDGKQLSGNYLRIRSAGTRSFKLAAFPETRSFSNDSTQGAWSIPPPAGNYQVLFQGEEQTGDATVAKFWNSDGALFGTFIAPDGDYGLLAGKPADDHIQLSRFTGWQAIAIVIEPDSGAWSGKFFAASNTTPLTFTLRPRDDLAFEIPSARRTAMKDPGAGFAFSCLSAAGEMVRHTDERFKGKALIVDIMGTWCHNCLDEAPVLQQLQQQFGKDGLEIVGLSFEINDDPAVGNKNLELFKNRFGLTYTLLFCGSLDEENVKKQLHSQLDNFFAYPTALFIDKNHKVQSIHSGFKGPGTGEEFQRQVREFHETAAKLLP